MTHKFRAWDKLNSQKERLGVSKMIIILALMSIVSGFIMIGLADGFYDAAGVVLIIWVMTAE